MRLPSDSDGVELMYSLFHGDLSRALPPPVSRSSKTHSRNGGGEARNYGI